MTEVLQVSHSKCHFDLGSSNAEQTKRVFRVGREYSGWAFILFSELCSRQSKGVLGHGGKYHRYWGLPCLYLTILETSLWLHERTAVRSGAGTLQVPCTAVRSGAGTPGVPCIAVRSSAGIPQVPCWVVSTSAYGVLCSAFPQGARLGDFSACTHMPNRFI